MPTTTSLELFTIIEKIIAEEQLNNNFSKLSDGYRKLKANYSLLKDEQDSSSKNSNFLLSNYEQLAYMLTRMPATFAVATKIMQILAAFNLSEKVESLLDLGVGSGSVLWAVIESLPNLRQITGVDQNLEILEFARKIASYAFHPIWEKVIWQCQDFRCGNFLPHDLVTLSYALIEQKKAHFDEILDKIWSLARHVLIIIEPGTSQGYKNCLYARDYFINLGAFIAAPCSHHGVCPIKGKDWCHFAERSERSHWQRSLKEASLGYEDEAFSYLIITRNAVDRGGKRILKPPKKRSGHIIFDLCEPDEIAKLTISRSEGIKYKLAKKKKWGDCL